VCGILYQAFNNAAILGQYHLKLEFSRYQRDKNEFWPVVNDIRSKFKDSVRQIRMDFKGKEEDEETDSNDVVSIMRMLAKKSESTAAVMLSAEGDGEVKLDELHDDLSNMADICVKQKGKYDLTVKFKTFGLYRYGADIMAQFGVEDEVIEEFENGVKKMNFETPEGSFSLTQWLDRMHELLKDYANEVPVQKGRNHRRRR
jgi:hypothetical protein